MTPVEFHGGRVRLLPGDCLESIKTLPDCSVDAVVTDPPYALVSIVKRFGKEGAAPAKGDVYARASAGFMSQRWDTGEVAFAVEFWREVFRVLRPGGFVSAFGGTRTYHQLATAIEGAGFEIRDRLTQFICSDTHVLAFLASLTEDQLRAFVRCIEESQFGGELAYVFGVGFPKNHNTGRHLNQSLGWWDETELERGEMAMSAAMLEGRGTAIKPAMEPICLARKPMIGTVVENVLMHGTGALNIDECRIESAEVWQAAGELSGGLTEACFGNGLNNAGRSSSHALGRWPANVLHDCSPEVVAAFPAVAGAFAPVRGTEPSAVTDAVYGARGRAAGAYHADQGSAARFYYGAKADADDRIGSKHPTVKDPDLIRWLVRLTCPPGGTVLDMFAGTGTTGEAAFREGRKAILCEREPAYLLDIARRMDLTLAGPAIRRAERAKARNKTPAPAPLFGEP